MKRITILLLGIIFSTAMFAQNFPDQTIGARFAGGNAFAAELSYQKALGSNRLELDGGIYGNSEYSHVYGVAIYQWNKNIIDNLNWYYGLGAGAGTYIDGSNTTLSVAIAGQIGIEYNFNEIPIQLSLDYRPQINILNFNNNYSPFTGDIVAFSIRYIMGR